MKRAAALFLVIFLIVEMAACGKQPEQGPSALQPDPAPTDEYQRAIWYGFAEEKNPPEAEVSEKQMTDMLERMLAGIDETAAEEWKKLTEKASDTGIVFRDYGALMLLVAAELVEYTAFNHRGMANPYHPEGMEWTEFFKASQNYPLFTQLERSPCVSIGKQVNDRRLAYPAAAMTFAFSRFSLATGTSLLEMDEQHLVRGTDRMTYQEAALAVVRLRESDEQAVASLPEDAAAVALGEDILSEAGARRDKILTSETTLVKGDSFAPGETYTGNAYYVSNSGSDQNDGRSPETAWATTKAVNDAALQRGDAVFFQRGGTWRGARIETREGVTYSAYGTGEKPKLIGSPENGSGGEKWTLWQEGEDGSKIWVYYRDLPDCGNVVLNGRIGTEKLVGFWNGQEYLKCPTWQYKAATGMPDTEYQKQPALDIPGGLATDLSFFSKADSLLPDTLPIYTFGWITGDQELLTDSVGPLYLRCDGGNPGEQYQSIEFVNSWGPFDGVVSDCTIDNLSIGFFNDGILSLSEGDGSVVQNCEVSWCGGYVSSYSSDSITGYSAGAPRSAGGVGSTSTSRIQIRNNCIHDLYHAGTGVEIFVEQSDEVRSASNITIQGNLLYRCGTGINYFNWDEEENPNHMFKNLVVEDNLVLFCGMTNWHMDRNSVGVGVDGGPNLQEDCVFRNNAFFGAADTLFYINQYVPENLPAFEGNRYLQLGTGGYLWSGWEDYYSCLKAETVVRNVLQDQTGEFGFLIHSTWSKLDW